MFRRLTARWKQNRVNEADIRKLRSMSDHELADVGLTRGDIAAAVRFGRIF